MNNSKIIGQQSIALVAVLCSSFVTIAAANASNIPLLSTVKKQIKQEYS